MAKNILSIVIFIVALITGATSANAQQSDSVTINKYEYRALKMSTAASKKTDRSCLDFYGANLDSVSNCGGWTLRVGAGYSSLTWKNDEGTKDTEDNIQLEASLGYRFMHYGWIAAIVPEATLYMNPPTTVEGLRNSTTLGFGGKVTAEFFPHSPVQPLTSIGIKTRNLTAYDNLKNQKYDGNLPILFLEGGVKINIAKIWSKCQSLGETIHKSSLLYGELTASYGCGQTDKEWVDAKRYTKYHEVTIHGTIGMRF